MADDIQSNIRINIDTASAMDSIRLLQAQISAFHTQMSKMGAANAATAANMQQNLINSINASGKFAASITTIKTSAESFTTALEKNKLSLKEYFRYAGASSKSFGKYFATEFETINKVARERVKDLQSQYIKLGRDANGAMQAIKVRPLILDMENLGTKTQIAAQRQQLLNQLLKQGSTNLLNFGKNTQWAGRQLMVGFTIPLTIMGGAAVKAYEQMEQAAVKFKRVYGDMGTTNAQTEQMVKQVQKLALEYTKYGIAVADTMDMAAQAAAMGKTGADLLQQISNANKLSALGGVEQNKALETTISLTNAFGIASKDLSENINFLNSVENQTVLNIDDMTTAIPKAAPVIKQLGGNVKDLAFFLTAMKEGGVNASEGANAIKSGLASIINPTNTAKKMLQGFGINLTQIVEKDKGNLRKTVVDFAQALDTLDPLNRARAIEQMFGKFQFARLSTLFKNITQQGTQASRVLELANSSSVDLALLAQQELKKVESSPLFQFKKAMADFQNSLAPIGEQFLKALTPIIKFGQGLLDGFNKLNGGVKSFIVNIVGIGGIIGPVLLMTFGLLANAVANVIKGFSLVKGIFNGAGKSSLSLGEQVNYMTQEQIQAAAVASSLDQVHSKLKQTFTSEAAAVDMLTAAYERQVAAQRALNVPITPRGPIRKYASGGLISGPGNGTSDSILARVSNGEAIIPAASVARNPNLVHQLISGSIPGFADGGTAGQIKVQGPKSRIFEQAHFSGYSGMTGAELLNWSVNQPESVEKKVKELLNKQLKYFKNEEEMLAHTFQVYNNEVVNMTADLNNRLGQSNAGRKNATVTAGELQKEFKTSREQAHGQVASQLERMGVAPKEIQKIMTSLADELDKDLAKLSSTAKISGEELDKIIQGVYKKVGATSRELTAAHASMKEISGFRSLESTSSPTRLGLTTKDSASPFYKTQRLENKAAAERYSAEAAKWIDKVSINFVGTQARQYKEMFQKLVKADESAAIEVMNAPMSERNAKLIALAKKHGIELSNALMLGVEQGMVEEGEMRSPSRKAKKRGKDTVKGAIDGMDSEVPKAKKAGEKLGTAVSDGIVSSTRRGRRVSTAGESFTPGNMIIIDGESSQSQKSSKRTSEKVVVEEPSTPPTKSQKFGGIIAKGTSKIAGMGMKASMAGFAISGILSMFGSVGGPVGEISNQLSIFTMALTSVTSVLQFLPETLFAVEGGLMAGITAFAAPVAIAVGAIALLAGGIYLAVKAEEDRIQKLKQATAGYTASLYSSAQSTAAANIFGYTKRDMASKTAGISKTPATTQDLKYQQTLDKIIATDEFKKNFLTPTNNEKISLVDSLKGKSQQEVNRSLYAIGLQNWAEGNSQEGAMALIQAIQKAAGQQDVKLKFKNLSIDTKEGLKQFQTNISSMMSEVSKIKSDTQTMSVDTGLPDYNPDGSIKMGSMGGPINKFEIITKRVFSKSNLELLKIYATTFKSMFQSIGTAVKNNEISIDSYNKTFDTMLLNIEKAPNGISLMGQLINKLSSNVQGMLHGLKVGSEEFNLVMKGAMSGMTISDELLSRLRTYSDSNLQNLSSSGFWSWAANKKKALDDLKTAYKEYLVAAQELAKIENDNKTQEQKNLDIWNAKINKINTALDILSRKEDIVNKAYDKRLKALDNIQKANEVINQQSQDQLDLADALSKGDIAAAARAQAKMTADAATAANDAAKTNLETGRQNALASLTIVDKTGKSYNRQTLEGMLAIVQNLIDTQTLKGFDFSKYTKPKVATGGHITGPGSGTSDSIPAMLSNGEYVIRANAVKTIGVDTLDRLNQADKMKFANGGMVGYKEGGLSTNENLPADTSNFKDPHGWYVARPGAGINKYGDQIYGFTHNDKTGKDVFSSAMDAYRYYSILIKNRRALVPYIENKYQERLNERWMSSEEANNLRISNLVSNKTYGPFNGLTQAEAKTFAKAISKVYGANSISKIWKQFDLNPNLLGEPIKLTSEQQKLYKMFAGEISPILSNNAPRFSYFASGGLVGYKKGGNVDTAMSNRWMTMSRFFGNNGKKETRRRLVNSEMIYMSATDKQAPWNKGEWLRNSKDPEQRKAYWKQWGWKPSWLKEGDPTSNEVMDVAKNIGYFTPGIGSMMMTGDAITSAQKGDWGGAAFNAAGAAASLWMPGAFSLLGKGISKYAPWLPKAFSSLGKNVVKITSATGKGIKKGTSSVGNKIKTAQAIKGAKNLLAAISENKATAKAMSKLTPAIGFNMHKQGLIRFLAEGQYKTVRHGIRSSTTDTIEERQALEEIMMGIPKDTSPNNFPAYGFLTSHEPIPHTMGTRYPGADASTPMSQVYRDRAMRIINPTATASMYGHYTVITKPSVLSRGTYSFGDTLSIYSAFNKLGLKVPKVSKFGSIFNTKLGLSTEMEFIEKNIRTARKDMRNPYYSSPYIEAQVPGGFNVSEIEKILFNPDLMGVQFRQPSNVAKEVAELQRRLDSLGLGHIPIEVSSGKKLIENIAKKQNVSTEWELAKNGLIGIPRPKTPFESIKLVLGLSKTKKVKRLTQSQNYSSIISAKENAKMIRIADEIASKRTSISGRALPAPKTKLALPAPPEKFEGVITGEQIIGAMMKEFDETFPMLAGIRISSPGRGTANFPNGMPGHFYEYLKILEQQTGEKLLSGNGYNSVDVRHAWEYLNQKMHRKVYTQLLSDKNSVVNGMSFEQYYSKLMSELPGTNADATFMEKNAKNYQLTHAANEAFVKSIMGISNPKNYLYEIYRNANSVLGGNRWDVKGISSTAAAASGYHSLDSRMAHAFHSKDSFDAMSRGGFSATGQYRLNEIFGSFGTFASSSNLMDEFPIMVGAKAVQNALDAGRLKIDESKLMPTIAPWLSLLPHQKVGSGGAGPYSGFGLLNRFNFNPVNALPASTWQELKSVLGITSEDFTKKYSEIFPLNNMPKLSDGKISGEYIKDALKSIVPLDKFGMLGKVGFDFKSAHPGNLEETMRQLFVLQHFLPEKLITDRFRPNKFAKGGLVPKYFAMGGYARGGDVVPAMLTPGEFVVKKPAADRIGASALNNLNNGKSLTAAGDSVYNTYSINVNVSSNSSPQEIANTVMNTIRRVDNQRIRSSRV